MSVYSGVKKTARKLITKFGDKKVDVLSKTAGVFDPVAGRYTAETISTTTLTATILPLDKGSALDAKFMEGRVQSEMRKVVLGPDVEIAPGTELRFQGSSWNVLDCKIINIDGSGSVVSICYVERRGSSSGS